MERTDKQLSDAFRVAMQMRREMREQGATDRECHKAMENILRANWPVPPLEDWPWHARLPRCMHCDGYGLVIRTVVNRLKCTVEEGTPCSCRLGDKYRHRPQAEADFTAAGKVANAKPRGFSRWNG